MPGDRDQPLIGRDEECAAIDALLDRALAGRGGVALIRGEAGIGKTALVDDASVRAERRGFGVVRGRAWEFAEAPPYFPVWPCLRSLEIDPSRRGDGFALWESVTTALARATADRPIAWIVEDLHAADQPTLELLCFLAQPARGLRVALMLTARDRDVRITDRIERLLTRLGRDGVALRLSPLDRDQVIALASRTSDARWSALARDRLVERSGGNPLFVLECARALRAARGRDEAIPATVRELVLEQLDAIPPSTRTALSAAAVIGREFTARFVAALQNSLPARVIDDLASAVRAGIVNEVEPGRFAFAHALVHEAIERGIAESDRVEWHSRAAKILEREGDDPASLVECARHALRAEPGAQPVNVLAIVHRAVAAAERSGAYDRAFALLRDAYETLPSDSPAHGIENLLETARIAHAAGLQSEMQRFCRAAAEKARTTRDSESLARAALRFGAVLRPGMVDRELVRLLEEARDALAGSPFGLDCRVRARLAAALQPAKDPNVPIAMARQAIDDAMTQGDRDLEIEVLYSAGSALVDYAPVDERLLRARQLFDRARAAGDVMRALTASARTLIDEAQLGDFAAFETHLHEMLTLAREVGHPRATWRALLLDSMLATARGDIDRSDRDLVEVERFSSLVDDPALTLSLDAHQLHRACVLGRWSEAPEHLARMHDFLATAPGGDRIESLHRGWIAAGSGTDASSTVAGADRADDFLRLDGTFLCIASEIAATGVHVDQIQRLLDLVNAYPDPEFTGGHVTVTYLGPVARIRGLLLARVGHRADAERALREALERVKSHGFAHWIARIERELRDVVETEGSRDDSRRDAIEAPPVATPSTDAGMQRAGDVWTVRARGREVRVPESRGMSLLARLIARPDEELHVLALASDHDGAMSDSDAGETIDADAARAYRARLKAIEAALPDARPRDAERLRAEREALQDELAAAFGQKGARRQKSTSERARVNVQRRLKDAFKRIAEVDPELGRYFERAVRTGTYCSFRP